MGGVLDALLEGFAVAQPDPLPAAEGRFTVGDLVHVSVPGRGSVTGMVRRSHAAAPESHVVIAPHGGGQPHVVAAISDVRLNTPRQHADAARRRAAAELAAGSRIPVAQRKPGEQAGRSAVVEAFTPLTPTQTNAAGAQQVSQAQAGLAAAWNAAKHPRAGGGRFGYTTGGRRATRGGSARTVGPGSRGALVSSTQRQLGVRQTGVYDAQTQAAVSRFQGQHGLRVDGVIGRQTLAALRGDPNASKIAPGPIASRAARVHQAKAPAPVRYGGGVLV